VVAFAEYVVDFVKMFNVPLGEPFLVGDEEVVFSGAQPAREDAFEENVGIKCWFAGEKAAEWRDGATVGNGDIKPSGRQGVVNEIDVAVESHSVGAGDDVDFFHVYGKCFVSSYLPKVGVSFGIDDLTMPKHEKTGALVLRFLRCCEV